FPAINLETTIFKNDGSWDRDNVHFIHARIQLARTSYHLIIVYGPPTPQRRVQFWKDIDSTVESIMEPCFIGGDFNGGSGGLMLDSGVFSDLISRRELIDMGFSGYKFTWHRGPAEAPTVSKRLDRFLMNVPARVTWDEASVRHLPAVRSDHNSLYLSLLPRTRVNPQRRPFRFEAMWLSHPDCWGLIDRKWLRDESTPATLSNLQRVFKQWNREIFGNLFFRKDKILRRMQGIDLALANGGPYRLHRLQYKLWSEFELILLQEELFWYQRARSNWIKCGDRNTTFFHTSTINAADCWVTDSTEFENMWIILLISITLPASDSASCPLPLGGFPEIRNSDLLDLVSPMDDEEIWKSVRRMGAYKAPGIDGFQSVVIFVFFFWEAPPHEQRGQRETEAARGRRDGGVAAIQGVALDLALARGSGCEQGSGRAVTGRSRQIRGRNGTRTVWRPGFGRDVGRAKQYVVAWSREP
ncbi:LOW QUALITY PROTEIN: hypothetical protein V2J09_013421, partial [Rumex salicifolius]